VRVKVVMQTQKTKAQKKAEREAWRALVKPFEAPVRRKSIFQLVDSLGLYALCWAAVYMALPVSPWLVVPPALLGSGLLVRIFILFHDCCHGALFPSRRANTFWGYLCGVLTFTPFGLWRWEHNKHHAGAGNLDKRGVGDVWTMTVREYREASVWTRFCYRVVRNPLVLFVLAPPILFLVWQRLPSLRSGKNENLSVWWTNLGIAGMAWGMGSLFGWVPYLVIQAGMMMLAGMGGIWLFYVQHQFEDTYWELGERWDYAAAAIRGSSFYRLPRVLQWFSGNIGFHHVHHLSPRIPNYRLQACHESDPYFQQATRLTLLSSLRCAWLKLWDEEERKLISFRRMRELEARRRATPGGGTPAPA